MTKKQIEYLKLLGYVDSIEDEAILEHPMFIWEEKFIWKEETFVDVMTTHNTKMIDATTANNIGKLLK